MLAAVVGLRDREDALERAPIEHGALRSAFPVAKTDYGRAHASYLAHAQRVLGA